MMKRFKRVKMIKIEFPLKSFKFSRGSKRISMFWSLTL